MLRSANAGHTADAFSKRCLCLAQWPGGAPLARPLAYMEGRSSFYYCLLLLNITIAEGTPDLRGSDELAWGVTIFPICTG